jgi:hypothetical protein
MSTRVPHPLLWAVAKNSGGRDCPATWIRQKTTLVIK